MDVTCGSAAFYEWKKQQEDRSRWIPVSDRLPEDGEDVLVRYRYGHKTVCVVAYRVLGNDCWTMSVGDCFDFSDEEATHWMPLPEPPEVK